MASSVQLYRVGNSRRLSPLRSTEETKIRMYSVPTRGQTGATACKNTNLKY
jgi:hypothetical protein